MFRLHTCQVVPLLHVAISTAIGLQGGYLHKYLSLATVQSLVTFTHRKPIFRPLQRRPYGSRDFRWPVKEYWEWRSLARNFRRFLEFGRNWFWFSTVFNSINRNDRAAERRMWERIWYSYVDTLLQSTTRTRSERCCGERRVINIYWGSQSSCSLSGAANTFFLFAFVWVL